MITLVHTKKNFKYQSKLFNTQHYNYSEIHCIPATFKLRQTLAIRVT